MDLNDLATDIDKAENGDWVTNIPDMGDLELLVRGLGNADYRRMYSKLSDAVPRAKKVNGRLDLDEQEKITNKCLVACVLLDWRNLRSKGVDVPYSKEKAAELITDPRYRRLRDAVVNAAANVSEAAVEENEADAGNSETASAGT